MECQRVLNCHIFYNVYGYEAKGNKKNSVQWHEVDGTKFVRHSDIRACENND